MCGLFGIIPRPKKKIDIVKLNRLFENSRERGMDGNGFFAFDNADNWMVKKESGFELTIPNNPEFRGAKIILGHVRKASVGGWLDQNVHHPHVFGNRFVLIHNGTAKSATELAKKLGLSNPTESDSYAIGALITHGIANEISVEESIIEVCKTFSTNDTYSIMLFDMLTETLYTFRNSERPLLFFPMENEIVFGSISSFISSVYKSYELFGVAICRPIELPARVINKIDLKSYRLTQSHKKIETFGTSASWLTPFIEVPKTYPGLKIVRGSSEELRKSFNAYKKDPMGVLDAHD